MHLKPMKDGQEAAEADPVVAVAGGGGVALFDSMGKTWTADYLKVTGDLAVDLRSNIAAEARAEIVYERLISFTQDQGSKQDLQFLMTREITHMRAFTAALDSMERRISRVRGISEGERRSETCDCRNLSRNWYACHN